MGILRTDKISGLETPTPVTGSVYFDGDARNDNLNMSADYGDLDFQNTDFTFESWVYPTDMSVDRYWCSKGNGNLPGTAMDVRFDSDGQINISFYVSSTGYTLHTSSGVLQENVWSHVAVVRNGTSFKSYVNGKETSSATHNITVSDVSATFAIGILQGVGTGFKGYMSNFRFVRGKAVYIGEFTPSIYALEPIDGTVLLCCNNPDSVTAVSLAAVGTSKVITANGDVAASTFSPGLTRDFTFGTEFQGVTTFDTQGYFVPPSGTTEQRGRGRGVFSAATSPNDNTATNNIDYITIATTGNASDFGDLDESRQATSGGSDSTRGLFSGGSSTVSPSGNRNTISYITIASTSNVVNFGDLSEIKRYTGSTSDKTRTVIAGGANAPGPLTDTLEFVTTQSLGDATNFGDLPTATWAFVGTASSPTRGVYFGGSTSTSSSNSINTIVYVTIQTLGDALDFGDLTNVNAYTGPGGIVSSTTRGIRGGGGGANPFARVNTIDYVTMASTGNAQDFGDLSYAPNGAMGCSSSTRGIFAGGKNSSGSFNTIEYVTIASTGNAQDFGDMRGTYAFGSALSDCHGGLS